VITDGKLRVKRGGIMGSNIELLKEKPLKSGRREIGGKSYKWKPGPESGFVWK